MYNPKINCALSKLSVDSEATALHKGFCPLSLHGHGKLQQVFAKD